MLLNAYLLANICTRSILHSQAASQSAAGDSVLLLVLAVGSLRSQVGAAPATELQQQLQKQQRSSGGQTSTVGVLLICVM